MLTYQILAGCGILNDMSITVQKTPNPNALKFILPEKHFEKPLNYSEADAESLHPLAMKLFALQSIYNVFMVQDFITVNKLPAAEWNPLESQIQQIISEHFDL